MPMQLAAAAYRCYCCVLMFSIPTRVFSQTLSYQISLSNLIASSTNHSTSGNINILHKNDLDTIEIAYFPYLAQFTCGDGIPQNSLGVHDGVASISLAMQHLNTGNGTIVPEIRNLNQTCPLRFTSASFDTECQQPIGVDHVISLTDRSNSETDQLSPAAILGAFYSSISMPTSMISGLRSVPQISPVSTSSALDNKDQYKLFGRTIPNDDGTAIPFIAKLKQWNVQHLAVLYIDDSYGNAFMEGMVTASKKDMPWLNIATVNIIVNPDVEAIRRAVRKLVETQYTYFFGILFHTRINDIMEEAYDQGIAGTGRHNWIFSDGLTGYFDGLQFQAGSKLARAFRGAGVLTATGGIDGMTNYDKLDEAMRGIKTNEQDVEYLESLFPKDYADGKTVNHTIISRSEGFLSGMQFASPFLYDAVIALGLAACTLRSQGDVSSLGGEELFQSFKETTFEGTSGKLVFDSETGTRDPNLAVYLLENVVYDEDVALDPGMIQFKSVDADVFNSGTWKSLVSYSFNDGATNVPPDLPPLETERNYPNTALKIFGLILCGFIFIMAVGFSLWTFRFREKRVVKSSQPLFLYLISAGALLMGSSIIPLTIDLSVTDQAGANAACMSIPWLLAIGFSLTFSALFTKTYRVNEIMNNAARFKRVKITAVDVIRPMIALLLVNIVILTAWTVLDPFQHVTVVVSQDPFLRDTETYGICSSDHSMIFLGTLCAVNAGCLLVALWQAWKARKVSTDLQESSYIFIAMALILMVSFIGVPVIILAQDNSAVSYFLCTAVVFAICSSILILIYIPKVLALRKKSRKEHRPFRMQSSFGSTTSSEDEGIAIISSPRDQELLEKKVREQENEIHELKNLLGNGARSFEKGLQRQSSITFQDEMNRSGTRNSIDSCHSPTLTLFGNEARTPCDDKANLCNDSRKSSIGEGTSNTSITFDNEATLDETSPSSSPVLFKSSEQSKETDTSDIEALHSQASLEKSNEVGPSSACVHIGIRNSSTNDSVEEGNSNPVLTKECGTLPAFTKNVSEAEEDLECSSSVEWC